MKKGEKELPGLTDEEKPRMRGPKRASKVRVACCAPGWLAVWFGWFGWSVPLLQLLLRPRCSFVAHSPSPLGAV